MRVLAVFAGIAALSSGIEAACNTFVDCETCQQNSCDWCDDSTCKDSGTCSQAVECGQKCTEYQSCEDCKGKVHAGKQCVWCGEANTPVCSEETCTEGNASTECTSKASCGDNTTCETCVAAKEGSESCVWCSNDKCNKDGNCGQGNTQKSECSSGGGACADITSCSDCVKATEGSDKCVFCKTDSKCAKTGMCASGSGDETGECEAVNNDCSKCANGWMMTLTPDGVKTSCPSKKCEAAIVPGAIVQCPTDCANIPDPGVKDASKLGTASEKLAWKDGSCFAVKTCKDCLALVDKDKKPVCQFISKDNASKTGCMTKGFIDDASLTAAKVDSVTKAADCPAQTNSGNNLGFAVALAVGIAAVAVAV